MGQCYARKRHRAVGKETGKTSYRRAIQQYVEATGISPSPKNLVLFKIVGEPHWCYLVFYPSLQCIITYVALPKKFQLLSLLPVYPDPDTGSPKVGKNHYLA